MARIGGYVLIPPLGLVAAVVGVFVYRVTLPVLGVPLPAGLVLTVTSAAALFEAARLLLGRAGGLAVVSGWSVGFVAFLLPRSAGDMVIANDGHGVAYGVLGLCVLGWGVYRALTKR